jgi:hypothetical protein
MARLTKIDYASLGDSELVRTEAAMDLLLVHLIHSHELGNVGDWPKSFVSEAQSEQFVDELEMGDIGWMRLKDHIASALGTLQEEGSAVGNQNYPVATFSDASRLLRRVLDGDVKPEDL